MSKYQFSSAERYAVFTVHGEVCYLCRCPIDMGTFQVDHVIPESLEDDPDKLNKVLESFGLGDSFEINSFENWMPACVQCNNRKRAMIFQPAPIVLVELNKATEKAAKAREISKETRTSQQIGRALSIVEGAMAAGQLGEDQLERLIPLLEYHETKRESGLANTPLRISPVVEILAHAGQMVTVRGPYGIGSGQINAPNSGGFRCSVCGSAAWNGARCVICGTMDED